MTAIDDALQAVRQGKGSEDGFYDAFLNAEILVPLGEKPDPASPGSIKPVLIEAEGKKYLMIFDTEERLAAWAKREIPFAGLPGHALVNSMDVSIPWVLNVGTEHMKQFVPEELQWLKSAIAKP